MALNRCFSSQKIICVLIAIQNVENDCNTLFFDKTELLNNTALFCEMKISMFKSCITFPCFSTNPKKYLAMICWCVYIKTNDIKYIDLLELLVYVCVCLCMCLPKQAYDR